MKQLEVINFELCKESSSIEQHDELLHNYKEKHVAQKHATDKEDGKA